MNIRNFNLAAYCWRDGDVIAAQCLQTGSVVTADDILTAQSMMVELLNDEVEYNLTHKNLRNLFGTPAPFEIWEKFYDGKGIEFTLDFLRFKTARLSP